MNCVQPVNWKYCGRIDQWLIPDVIYGIEILKDIDIIYKTEREYLKGLDE
jgi:hypothetical protein